MKKRELNEIETAECAELKRIFNSKKEELKLTQYKLAEAVGVTQSAVNHYLNGTNALNASIASQFAKILQIPVSDFSLRLAEEISSMSIGIDGDKLLALQADNLDTNTITLNLYDVSASCGHGVVNPDYPQLLRSIEIPNDALFELLGTNNLTNVQLMPPDGDSMEPTIPQKSITLIKTDVSKFQTGGIYLFTFDGYTYIKRLSRGKGGAIHATSDNRHYAKSDFLINPKEADKFHIHGKFWKVLPLDFLDL
ncbi:helix-turn-helix domain-containing protein [Neisseria gonorrhoeae]